jgi:hypothetical protein
VDSVSPPGRDEGGIPGIRRVVAARPRDAAPEEDWHGAEKEKVERLRINRLQRRAGARGLELRHSDYGYALIDSTRKRIDERSDMTLKEIEAWLERA